MTQGITVKNGETITPQPRSLYNLGAHTRLTFIDSFTDVYDARGLAQSVTIDNGSEITFNDRGFALNLTLKSVGNTTLTAFDKDFLGHVNLFGTGFASTKAALPYLTADGFGGTKLTNSTGQTIVDFVNDVYARHQLTIHS